MQVESEAPPRRYRMKDLCEMTGLSRQTIHFYVQQGLLPAGHKTGRNMAYYDETHLRRLEAIQRLQSESLLPLKAIKAVLNGELDQLEPAHRDLLSNVKPYLPPGVVPPASQRTLEAEGLAEQHGLPVSELEQLGELGFITVLRETDGSLRIPASDTWAVELFGQMRAAGLTEARGFGVQDLELYERAMSEVFEHEKQLLLGRMGHLPAEQFADVLERVLPLVHAFMAQYHTALIRNLLASME